MNSKDRRNPGNERRLRVRRQTLRRMTDGQLGAVAGGGVAPAPKSNAWTGDNDDGGGDFTCTGG